MKTRFMPVNVEYVIWQYSIYQQQQPAANKAALAEIDINMYREHL